MNHADISLFDSRFPCLRPQSSAGSPAQPSLSMTPPPSDHTSDNLPATDPITALLGWGGQPEQCRSMDRAELNRFLCHENPLIPLAQPENGSIQHHEKHI